ncbi:MAG: DUF4091 domain-containing protein [Opitutaceae bacterium]
MKSWITSSLQRIFPSTPPGRSASALGDVALNERFSFQSGVRHEGSSPLQVRVEARGPRGWQVRVRRVGYVPLRHLNTDTPETDLDSGGTVPGYVPDPLFDECEMLLPSRETHAFWFSVLPGRGATAGDHSITVTVTAGGDRPREHQVRFRAHPVRIRARRGFRVTFWFYLDALIDWYRTGLFDDRFWTILPAYLRNLAEHGQDTLYVPVFTPPLDGIKRPTQLLKVRRRPDGGHAFDWSDVRRYLKVARECGIKHFEWCHLFTQWGAKQAIRVYEGQGADERLLWPAGTAATSAVYRRFLADYLPSLHRFLRREAVLDHSFFHVSDEPHGEQITDYRKARELLRDLAPWMPVVDALSDIEFGRSGLTDLPIPSIQSALAFHQEGIRSWCYYCCGPRGRYLNHLMDTPLAKIGMHGFVFYRWPFEGFLHWGANYWYRQWSRELIDPFAKQDAGAWPGWAFGDPFVIYPGSDGPIDSIRWEVFGESLQNHALLQTLGVDRDDPILRPIKSFEDFPKSEVWIRRTKRRLFQRETRD